MKKFSILFFLFFVLVNTLGLSALCTENNALPYPGCTDPCASNYDPNATTDDGSCIFPDCDDGCSLTIDELDLFTCTCINTPPDVDDACDLTTDSFDPVNCSIFNTPLSCDDGCPLTNDIFDELSCECVFTEPDVDDGCPMTTDIFDAINCQVINTPPDVDDGCPMTTDIFDIENCLVISTPPDCNDGDPNTDDFFSAATCVCSNTLNGFLGCTNPCADNYDPDAIQNDGSCVFPDPDDGCPMTTDFFDEVNCVVVNEPPFCDDGISSTADYFDPLSCECINSISLIQIEAFAFFDENENNSFDSGELIFQQAFNLNPDAFYSFTDQSGFANFYLEGFGEYELSLNNSNPLWEFSGTDNPIQISFQDASFNYTLYHFPMSPIADFVIQSIDLSSSITRCNQNTNYWLTYTNEGTTVNDGYIEVIPDETTGFVSANPPADSTAGDTLYWFYQDLYPTHSNQIHLVYKMPGVNEMGEEIAFEANIATNEGFGDDKATVDSELVCAYDPNDKLVSPSGYSNENYTLFEDTLEYTVRFQNTGNDTAFAVVIEDELSDFLDLSTFRPIASSHNMETQIDINNRLARFTFNDIYLPDSFVNEPASHGFVKYRILGNESLAENTIVENTANIFFDFNPAIVTNTTSNQMVSELPLLPILSASSDAVDFGEINLETLEGNIEPQTLIIENSGDLDLVIESMDIQGTDFSIQVETAGLIIEGKDNATVPIYFAPSDAGIYQSQLVIQSNVGELTIDLMGSAILGTGLNNIETGFINLFPNPNEGLFYIESKEHKILSFQVINSFGKTVLEQRVQNTDASQNRSKIDLRQQPKGIYFIAVKTADGMATQKFLVQ